MFLFGTKKDKYYIIAQNLFTMLADAAEGDWIQKILMQRNMMKKAKLCNFDSALALFFKRLPDEARPKVPNDVLERPFASARLKKGGKEFYADFNIGPDGTICAIQFTFFPMDGAYGLIGVDFYPEILGQPFRARRQDAAFRISEKLVSILGAGWSETVPPGDPEAVEYCPALPPEHRELWLKHVIHTELPDDWQEFSKYFSELVYHGATVYGCTEEMQLVPMHSGDTAMYLVARIPNEDSDIGESFVLASSDKAKWNSLYYLADYDGTEADSVPIGTDLFGFLRKAEDPAFLKSLKKG